MALFGFNKQKVLATAEKHVQQGKLQNAISEYEKILKHDAKDLTVTNTVGDLYSRLGEPDKATGCFKTVGDAYASQGFTVKAIAMYKKICKLKPSLESSLKLAELYTQQGLFNDARAQYMQVAEEFLKANELENAVRILQKILEMDPENAGVRVKLADAYVRLGKKTEAWQIFSAAVESMRSKGSLSGAEEVLQRMLKLDPNNAYALLIRARTMLDSGDAAGAVAVLQKISDIDSNKDGLRDLLRAYLQTGQLAEAGTVAGKLLTVHNDLQAISSYGDALLRAGQYADALQVFSQHAERLLAQNPDKVLETLHSIIGHVRENPDSLQKLLDLFQKAGDSTHVSEVMELLAHACVQSGDLPRARNLYQRLAQIEPQNPLHMQNYRQVVSQLGGNAGGELITPEEAAVLLDDLEAAAPSIHQHYSDEIALAVRSALTDAELFISYNMPAKALSPLLSALPLAPKDVHINQRLAALYTRSGHFAEAALCCRTLQTVYSEADYPDEATRYRQLADRYEERAPAVAKPASGEAASQAAAETESSSTDVEITIEADSANVEVQEFFVEAADPASHESTTQGTTEEASPWPKALAANAAAEAKSNDDSDVPATEIDLSSEWDDAITIDADSTEEAAAPEPADAVGKPATSGRIEETVEEIRFYLAHEMSEQAAAALTKLQALSSHHPQLAELRAAVETAVRSAAQRDAQAEPEIEELNAEDIPALDVSDVASDAVDSAATSEAPAPAQPAPEAELAVAEASVKPEAESEAAPMVEASSAAHAAETKSGVLQELVTDLESSLGDSFLADDKSKPAEPSATSAPKVEKAAAAAQPAPVLGELVTDIENALGDDFLADAPSAPTAKAAVAAAGAGSSSSVAAQTTSVPVASAAAAKPAISPSAAAPASASSPSGSSVDLSEMFGELKHDLEDDVPLNDGDPETHYSLGIAFREMGLLDEAISELQKACLAFEHGQPFSQILQAYTWLANCFLEKNVPEAAVRWYDKALTAPNIDGETRMALTYELASAYEAAGDKPVALKHFLTVYGTNIDYRDVSERIRMLKS